MKLFSNMQCKHPMYELKEKFHIKNKIKIPIYDNRILLFLCTIIIGNIIFWIAAALTDFQSAKTLFFRWDFHTFMDWYSEFMRLNTGDIYTGDSVANYPAFSFLIYRLFYSFVPQGDVRLSDGYTIRTMQQTLVPFTIFMVLLVFMFYHIFKYELRDKTNFESECVAFTLLISAPFLHVFERGNQIIIALVFTMLYVMLYDSNKKYLRVISYLCLSVAAAIKLYPAVFGILTLEKKRYKEAIVLIVMGIVTFFAPFALYGGIDGLIAFFNSIMSSFESFYDFGFGYDFSIYNLERLILSLIFGYQTRVSNISGIVILFILITAYIIAYENWQRFAILALAIIFLPKFSYFYTIGFLTISIIYMFKSECRNIHYLYLFEYLLIYFPWLHFPLEEINFMSGEEFGHTISVGHIIIYIGLLGLLITILSEGFYYRLSKKHRRNEESSMEAMIS